MLNVNGQFHLNEDINCADKSVSHRALILASIASGESEIRNLSLCDDVKATAECLRALGAEITLNGTTARVKPIVNAQSGVVLDCKNSGTTARLLAGLVAGLGVKAKFVGDSSLCSRPMDRVLSPLFKMGAKFSKSEGCLFELLGGKLSGKSFRSEVDSAQVKSAVLIAGLFADGETSYCERIPTRAHTERMLEYLGANVRVYGSTVAVRRSTLKALNTDIPNDPSSAAYIAALAVMKNTTVTISSVLADERRTGFFRVLKKSGADIEFLNEKTVCNEKVCDISVSKSVLRPLNATERDVCDGIDEVCLLAATALTVKGRHRFENVSELRYKESDRISAIINMARSCRKTAFLEGRDLIIDSDGELLKNPCFKSFGDHRIAMCETVLSLFAGGGSVDETPFGVSFPNFLQALGVSPLKLALIGADVSQSRSPVLMEYLAKNAGVCCSYEKISLGNNASFEKIAETLKRYDGLNVTMPYKRAVSAITDAEVPSVNTVGKKIKPQSTDGYGLITALKNNGVPFENRELLVVGAGGAAEECVRELLKFGCKIKILNRTAENAEKLTAKYRLEKTVNEPFGVLSFVPECEFEKNIVLPQSAEFVFVAAYKGESGLRNQAKARNVKYVDGFEMLYHQGAKSFSLWTGTPVQNDYGGFLKFYKERTERYTI